MSDDNIDNLSLADSIEAAFDEYENQPEEIGRPEEDTEVEVRAEETEAETPEDRTRDEQGRFAAKDKADTEADGQAAAQDPAAGTEVQEQAAVQPESDLKAPQSWKPMAREDWSKVPQAIKEEVLRRETEINTTLQQTAEARKVGEDLMAVATPYLPLIEAENSTPIQAAENMFRTAAMLKTGSPIQRAGLIADIVKQYSIDISLLDTALSSGIQSPQQFQGQQQMPQQQGYQDPRVDQLFSMIENTKRENENRRAEKSAQEVASFGQTHEFFEDVREDMADLIEISSTRGVTLSLEDAYNRSIAMHPEISKVIAQRQQAQNAGASTVRSRRAASSVKSKPMTGTGPENNTLRDYLEDAFNVAG